jgi:hypothetical protein
MLITHGGDWDLQNPYDSMGAFMRAYDKGTDAVKGDFRVSKDNIGVVTHSSPIEIYESLDCVGRKIEDMTAAQITKCHMAGTNWTFASLPQLLQWADQKVIVMLCVKQAGDIPRAISSIIENNATDRAFLEIHAGDVVNLVPKAPGFEQVYYLAELGSIADVTALLNSPATLKQAFMYEFHPPYSGVNVTQMIVEQLHPKNIRATTPTPTQTDPSVQEQEGLFHELYDVVYTYGLENGVVARTAIDKERGVVPP